MIVEIRQVVHKPETIDKDGIETKPAYAVLTVVIEKDTDAQKEAIHALSDLVSTEQCEMSVTPKQVRLDM